MSLKEKEFFTKQNLEIYLKELAKEYRKLSGKKIPADIVLVGGASILINYGFREMTNDVDAIINASSVMKEAANKISDKYGLPNGWINADFSNTSSYSKKLFKYARYYRTFSNIVRIYTINAEYLIAMKLRSGRKYKNDFSDILGILNEHLKNNKAITIDSIKLAACQLYNSWDDIPEESKEFIENAIKKNNYEDYYSSIKEQETSIRQSLILFDKKYKNVLKESNVNEIIEMLKEKE